MDVVALVDEGPGDSAEVVDVRQIDRLAANHATGSLANPWRAQFATWLGASIRLTEAISRFPLLVHRELQTGAGA